MSEGLIALFEGSHFWHMPAGLKIETGPTISIPLPKEYLADTARYSSQVELTPTPEGGFIPSGYVWRDCLFRILSRETLPLSASGSFGIPTTAISPEYNGPDLYLYTRQLRQHDPDL